MYNDLNVIDKISRDVYVTIRIACLSSNVIINKCTNISMYSSSRDRRILFRSISIQQHLRMKIRLIIVIRLKTISSERLKAIHDNILQTIANFSF